MDCRELEERLEALLDGALDEPERRRCARHLERCASCRELAEPFAATEPPPEGLLGAVLTATSGSPCRRAEQLLCGWLDGELERTDRELMAAHLASCGDCRALAAVVTRLSRQLPLLAELRPDPGFVAAVLAATLPIHVRLRRWWTATWPRWVRRPRFASEAAFIATMVLALVFATPGSPLEAVPGRALELARSEPGTRIEARLEAPVKALEERFSASVKAPLTARYAEGEAKISTWLRTTRAWYRAAADRVSGWLGTSRELLASLLGSADKTAPDSKDSERDPNQETP